MCNISQNSLAIYFSVSHVLLDTTVMQTIAHTVDLAAVSPVAALKMKSRVYLEKTDLYVNVNRDSLVKLVK